MLSKHTPGPWYCGTFRPVGNRPGIDIDAADSANIALCHYEKTEMTATETKANARLIASAPELLAALQAILNRYIDLAGSGDCGNWNPETEPQVIQARAAIAKATT